MELFGKHYSSIWKALIRPPRQVYKRSDLGPSDFCLGELPCKRHDIRMTNQRKLTVECSFYQQKQRGEQVPTVIYLHGNSSSRLTAIPYVHQLLLRFDVLTLDLSGSGRSDGQYVSLGYHEKEDLKVAVKYLKEQQGVNQIFIWGRSMGAVTALLYASKYGGISGLILDSPFCDLEVLVKETALLYVTLPDFVVSILIESIREHIKKLMKEFEGYEFDILSLRPVKDIVKINVPVYFIAGKEDKLISHQHTVVLYNKCPTRYKKLQLIQGGHNGIRNKQIVDRIVKFVLEHSCVQRTQNVDTQNEFESLLVSADRILQQNERYFLQTDKNRKGVRVRGKNVTTT